MCRLRSKASLKPLPQRGQWCFLNGVCDCKWRFKNRGCEYVFWQTLQRYIADSLPISSPVELAGEGGWESLHALPSGLLALTSEGRGGETGLLYGKPYIAISDQ